MSEASKLVHQDYVDPLTGKTFLAYERFTFQQEHSMVDTGAPIPLPGRPVTGRNQVPTEWKPNDKKDGYKDLIMAAFRTLKPLYTTQIGLLAESIRHKRAEIPQDDLTVPEECELELDQWGRLTKEFCSRLAVHSILRMLRMLDFRNGGHADQNTYWWSIHFIAWGTFETNQVLPYAPFRFQKDNHPIVIVSDDSGQPVQTENNFYKKEYQTHQKVIETLHKDYSYGNIAHRSKSKATLLQLVQEMKTYADIMMQPIQKTKSGKSMW